MSNLSDIVTIGQNIVKAINALAGTTAALEGTLTSATVTASAVVATGSGRLVSVSVTVKGTGAGTINNASAVAAAAAGNVLLAIPDTDVAVIPAGQTFNAGLVIVPGTGQSINVTYYQP